MMKNKKIALIITTLFLALQMSYGQKHQRLDHEKIKTLKVAFYTEQLDLSSKEAQLFWPLYNEYEKKNLALHRREHREIRKQMKNPDLTEKEAANLLQEYLTIEEKEEELDKAFYLKIKNVISARKTILLISAEENFKKRLIRQYQKKHGGR
ncbi:MAG: hypothetical protein COA50_13935 [Flavobacteriaceae bacterium]|nr:MAG: hypothetical protein COA50_13935 [Flavobacteriaceae bacterium]